MVAVDLLELARTGDGDAFAQLTEPHRRELHVHCYRILGSVQDAEDALQETLLTAWRSLGNFEERASLRTWLYRIATSRCLNALRAANRRPQMAAPFAALHLPEPTSMGEVPWLEPYPDVLLTTISDHAPSPEARYESREAISLAFMVALQTLPPRQRVVLILRDVLGFKAKEVAQILETTEESVTSALKRARATLDHESDILSVREAAPAPNSPIEREIIEQLVQAYETNDLDGVITLLSDDVWLRMPPIPLEYQGRDLARQFFSVVAFRPDRTFRLVATRANGQPAFGVYVCDRHGGLFHAIGLLVLTLAGNQISEMTRFDNSVLPGFGLPRTLADSQLD